MIGRTLGHYEITDQLGEGGMGQVYLARDTRLGRDVAIKVLPSEFAADPERRERLRREATTISKLNHPHVCTLHDIGHEDGVDFLVLEHVQGRPLSEAARGGRLPLREILTLAAQVADGLDAAHRLGIVHRDLKPANVMLTASGAKLLDFGLAKETGAGSGPVEMTATRAIGTTPGEVTAEGTILGTLQYMSPEQLHGEPADGRSDLFSFGAMLYELLTGRPPFGGKSPASVIASILEVEPEPLSSQAEIVPPALERLVHRCLEKDPERRWQNARDLMLELEWIRDAGPESSGEETDGPARAGGIGRMALAAIVALLIGGFLGTRFAPSTPPPAPAEPAPMVRATIPLPDGYRVAGWASPTVAIDPDGTTVAVVGTDDASPQVLFVRDLDASEWTEVPGSQFAEGPVFSPDGEWVLFAVAVSGGDPDTRPELRLHSLETGLTQTLCPVRDYFGATWHPEAGILWVDQQPKGLWHIDPEVGEKSVAVASVLEDGAETQLISGWINYLPDPRFVIGSRLRGGDFGRGFILDLEERTLESLGVHGSGFQLLPTGDLTWVDRQGTVMVAPFDAGSRRLTGGARAVEQGISYGGAGRAVFSVSANGTAVLTRGHVLGSRVDVRHVVRIDPDGKREVLPLEPGPHGSLALSPDGSELALASAGKITIYHLARRSRTEVPLGSPSEYSGSLNWSPDGRWLAFRAFGEAGKTLDVYVVGTDGVTASRLVFPAESEARPLSWESDSQALLVSDFATEGEARLRTIRVPLDGSDPTEVELGDAQNSAQLDPGGTAIAYLEDQLAEASSIFLRSYPDLGPRLTVATGRYRSVRWSADGSTLYGFGPDHVDAFRIERTPSLNVTERRFRLDGVGTLYSPVVDVTAPDTFYALVDVPGAGILTSIEVIPNWAQNVSR